MYYSTIRTTLFALVAVGLFAVTGCDQTINKSPEQDIPSDQVFNNVAGAEAALTGVYDELQQEGNFGGFPVIAADFTGDNVTFSGSFTTYNNAEAFNVTSEHGPTQSIWQDGYSAINRANLVIDNTPNVPGISQSKVDEIVGQAKFIRALVYFHLVRWFARPYNPGGNNDHPGVILQTEGVQSLDPEFNQPRASVGDVYSQIRTDLQDAISRLGVNDNAKFAGTGAANALLAKVSLYQGRWDEAASRAQDVIQLPAYELSATPSEPYYQENSSEILFAVAMSSIDGPPDPVNEFPGSFYLPSDNGGRGDANPSSDFLSDAISGDIRTSVGPYTGSALLYQLDQALWTNKWTEPNLGDDVIRLRVAEMHLIRAEGLARGSGSASDARTHVNNVRDRAGLGDVSPTLSGQALIDEIIRQRRFELAFEGDRRHDLQRLGRVINSGSGSVSPGDPQRILPIPQRAIDVNDALDQSSQNPGY